VRDQALQGHLCCFCRRKNEGRKCWLLIYSYYIHCHGMNVKKM
jgi:hypothetical protein